MTEAVEKIGIVGLGYVGLPLASVFARHFPVVGFDVKTDRIGELNEGHDSTLEVEPEQLRQENLHFTDRIEDLADCTFLIVTVPTPINEAKEPDLTAVRLASESVGSILKKGMMVVYESTVYPGVTEELCLPILEKNSGLKLGDFDLGYSPERVNPGDKEHTIDRIIKVVSGHSPASGARAAAVYGRVITAGIHRAPNIKTAEAAKVIENVQRDLNIALMNELSRIFALVGVHTPDVLAAAGTKWNFHQYTPGLVGGHCIGVDPYYLTHRALQLGYNPEVILAGRRINDSMGPHVGDLTIRALNKHGVLPRNARIWVLGLTFKENVPDMRNTRAVDVVAYLQSFGVHVMAWEPLVPAEDRHGFTDMEDCDFDQAQDIDAVILINGHHAFQSIDLAAMKAKMRKPILVDIKAFFDRDACDQLGFDVISL